jgi:hypothetical protein
MKNSRLFSISCFLCLLTAGGAFLGAQDSGEETGYWRMPDRLVEFGLDIDGGFGNSLMRVKDIFNHRKTMLIDLSALNPGELNFGSKADISAFINVNVLKDIKWFKYLNFGIFAGSQIDAYYSAEEEFTRLLRHGNAGARSVNTNMTAGASIFVDAGVRAEAGIGKFRFAVKPALYSPLIYMPPPNINVTLAVDNSGMVFSALADLDVYSAFSLEGMIDGAETGKPSIPLGFDIGLEGGYALLPSMDLGVTIDSIPLFPAKLRHRMRQSFEMAGDWSNMYDKLSKGDFDIPDMESSRTFESGASFNAFRPLRIDFFAEFRPAVADVLVLRPHLGLSALTIFGYDAACFNAGLEGQLNIINMFGFSIGTDYEERMWKHSLGFRMNFRAVELNARFGLWGPDIISSFRGRGFGAALGIRLGF